MTSALLASAAGVDVLAIITGVPQVYLDFGKSSQRGLVQADLRQIEGYIAEGQFPEGSMLPKITAAIRFLKARGAGDARAIITDWSDLPAALAGMTGTTITL